MGTRGRKSSAELATRPQAQIDRQERPKPPIELASEQCEVWWQIVNDYPADHFDAGQLHLLSDYCKHIVSQRRLGQLIALAENPDEFDKKAYFELLKQQRAESNAKAGLARALGIAQRSVYTPKDERRGSGKAPWQYQS